jgi:hypothetical protein
VEKHDGKIYVVKDLSGSAGKNKITINGNGSLIEGK